jgi:hypothetical protein
MEVNMTAIDSEPRGGKFGEDVIEKRLQELADLYEHDYKQPMPELRPGAGFADKREIERLGRLAGVAIKKGLANEVAIDPTDCFKTSTGSYFAYEFGGFHEVMSRFNRIANSVLAEWRGSQIRLSGPAFL